MMEWGEVDLAVEYNTFTANLINFVKNITIKNDTRAEEHESADTLKAANRWMLAYRGVDTFNTYKDYTLDEMLAVGMTYTEAIQVLDGNMEISAKYHNSLLLIRRAEVLEDYEEQNDYYRMLMGLPKYGEEAVRTSSGKFVTELTDTEIFILMQYEIETLMAMYPEAEYLRYLGDRKVDLFTARTAKNYEILKYEYSILGEEAINKFVSIYYKCRTFITVTNYSKFHANMYYYDAFIILLILFMSMQTFIADKFRDYIRRDFVELEDIRNMFESYGLPFFAEIPVKYQQRIVKNINHLLKYKGTDRVLIDIVELFGFNNAELNSYYLVKHHKTDEHGDIIIDPDDISRSFDLRFAQVPLSDSDISEALTTSVTYQTYEEVVGDDPLWGPHMDEDDDNAAFLEFKEEIMRADFNYIPTKYLSINTIFDVSKHMTDLAYFFNLINTLEREQKLDQFTFVSADIRPSGTPIHLFDAITAINILLHKKFGFDDTIKKTSTSIASLYSFQFNKDMVTLLNNIEKRAKITIGDNELNLKIGKDIKSDLIQEMTLDDKEISRDDLITLYFKNLDYRDMIEERINTTENIQELKALRAIYEYNMTSEYVLASYGEHDTYSGFLNERDPDLFNFIEDNSGDDGAINMTINTLLFSLEAMLNHYRFDDMFATLSSISGDIVKEYMRKIINIFKSYTVEVKDINIFYVFDEKIVNSIRMLSLMTIESNSGDLAEGMEYFEDVPHLMEGISLYKDKAKMREDVIYILIMALVDKALSNINMYDEHTFKMDKTISDSFCINYHENITITSEDIYE